MALRLGPGFASHGYEFHIRSSIRKVPLRYLELPVQGRVAFGTGRARPYLLAGAFVGRRLNADDTIDDLVYVDNDPTRPIFVRHKENWRRWNFGVTGGAGVEVAFRRVGVLLEVTYDRGLTDVYSARNLGEHVQSLRVAVGLTLPLGRRPPSGGAVTP